MRRQHRHILTLLCLVALVWCQTAMAARWCQGGLVDDAPSSGCHGLMDEAAGEPQASTCPSEQLVPDLGKLPAVPSLLPGHDYPPAPIAAGAVSAPPPLTPLSSDRSCLDTLCRRLI